MGILEFFSDTFKSAMEITPKPIKFLLFLFLILIVSNFIIALGLGMFYDCSSGIPYDYNGHNMECNILGTQLAHCKAEWFFKYVNASTSQQTFNNIAWSTSTAVLSFHDVIFDGNPFLIPKRFIMWFMDTSYGTPDPCMLMLNTTDIETGESSFESVNVTNFRQSDVFNYCGATIAPSYLDRKRDFLSIGCDGTDTAMLIGEKINPFNYQLWLILMILGTAGFYAYNSWKNID